MKSSLTIVFIFYIFLINLKSQDRIQFVDSLKIIANENVNEIKKGEILIAKKLKYDTNNNGFMTLFFSALTSNGKIVNVPYSKFPSFEFLEINSIEKYWEKKQIQNGVYLNLLTKGYQYDLRNELNNEAIDYVNTLSRNDRFFDDKFLEDYLYSIINKIHVGILKDKRPGNLHIKIIKDIEPNAYILSNGCIIISTGLLSTIQSEDELVGVLAHEVAHFVLDHHITNYNKEIDRKKRAEFWSTFATAIAGGTDIYLSYKNKNYIPGLLTTYTSMFSTLISEEIIQRLGLKYSQLQESEADIVANEILNVLNYKPYGLSVALTRIKDYCILTGNFLALSGNGTHPNLESRIFALGITNKLDPYTQPSFLKKVSLINSYNAWIELWYNAHHLAAKDLADRNIKNNIATESDFIVRAVVDRRLYNTTESNEEVVKLLNKAKTLNITPYIIISKEEGITYLRLSKKNEAKLAFQNYLNSLLEIKKNNTDIDNVIEEEINWTKKMIFKVDNL